MVDQEQSSTPAEPAPEIIDGKWYAFTLAGVDIMFSTKKTVLDAGTHVESLRQIAKNQDRRIKELLKQNDELQAANADLADRLDNLRTNHRKLVAAGVERQLADLDLNDFLSPPTKDLS
jgi:hypothetical protein